MNKSEEDKITFDQDNQYGKWMPNSRTKYKIYTGNVRTRDNRNRLKRYIDKRIEEELKDQGKT